MAEVLLKNNLWCNIKISLNKYKYGEKNNKN